MGDIFRREHRALEVSQKLQGSQELPAHGVPVVLVHGQPTQIVDMAPAQLERSDDAVDDVVNGTCNWPATSLSATG